MPATLAGLAGLVGAIIIVLGLLYLLNGTLLFASGTAVAAMATSAASGQQIDDGLETQVEALIDREGTEGPQVAALATQVQALATQVQPLATRAADDDALATRVGSLSGQLAGLERSSATQRAQLARARIDLATSEAIGARNRARLGVLDRTLGSFRDALLTAEPLPTPTPTPRPGPTFTPAAALRPPPATPANLAATPTSQRSGSVSGGTHTALPPTSPVKTGAFNGGKAGTATTAPLFRGTPTAPTPSATDTPSPPASATPSPSPAPTATERPSPARRPGGEL